MAEDLWSIRKHKGMSVPQLAAKSGVPARLISDYESGQRSIRSMDLPKLANALYVDEMDIKMTSDSIPQELMQAEIASQERQKARSTIQTQRTHQASQKTPPAPEPASVRPTQVSHMEGLARRLGMDLRELETEVGKTLGELTRSEASDVLGKLQQRIREEKPPRTKSMVDRHRPYLPESVDAFELNYLTEAQENKTSIEFTLFNGNTLTGNIVGFSPYAITLNEPVGSEVTIQKLAIAFYRKMKPAEDA